MLRLLTYGLRGLLFRFPVHAGQVKFFRGCNMRQPNRPAPQVCDLNGTGLRGVRLSIDPMNTYAPHRPFTIVVFIVFAAAICVPSVTAQGWEWWNDVHVRRDLRLSESQVRSLDTLFREDLVRRRAVRAALDAAQKEFDDAIRVADESTAVALIPRITTLSTEQNKARAVLLLRMSWVLTRAQQDKLNALRRQRALLHDRHTPIK
jgi:hypothetical protein